MNTLILDYNTISGKYKLIGNVGFLCDTVRYEPMIQEWVFQGKTTGGKYLDYADCTKPTAKALKEVANAIEAYYV